MSFAVVYGVLTHFIFAVAVTVMSIGLYTGLSSGWGRLDGWLAVLANLLLLVQFPIVHSYLLSTQGRKVLSRLSPMRLGADLAPTSFVLFASLQLIMTFVLWSPSGVVLGGNEFERWLFRAFFVGSWIFLLKSLADAGLGLQTGYIGWVSVARGKPVDYGAFPTSGLFRFCRHPVYLGFALVLWTAPVHTFDGLLLAVIWSAYCVIAPRFKEERYLKWHGDSYRLYRDSVPYMIPRFRG
ncbi:MAG: hypothetical protein AMXMBFR84_15320 [Candidatus Hydrogenedentota bacterium]